MRIQMNLSRFYGKYQTLNYSGTGYCYKNVRNDKWKKIYGLYHHCDGAMRFSEETIEATVVPVVILLNHGDFDGFFLT